MKKSIYIFLLLSFYFPNLISQVPTFTWVTNSNTLTADANVNIDDMALDLDYNLIVVGSYFKNAQFGTTIFQSGINSFRDSYVAKLDPLGNFIWSLNIDSTIQIYVRSVEIDSESNIYIVGSFSGNVTLGNFTLISDNQSQNHNTRSSFIAKISPNGDFLWAKKIENLGIFNLEINNEDELLLMSVSHGQFTFDDIFYYQPYPGYTIIKLTNDGNPIWIRRIIDNGNNGFGATSIKTDQYNNIYIACSFSQSAQLGNITVYGNAQPDILVTKIDNSGNFLWASHAGGVGIDYGQGLVIDEEGSIFIAGLFSSPTIDFGSNTISLYEDNKEDIYIAKLNSLGEFIWAKSFQEQGIDVFQDLEMDNNGEIYLSQWKAAATEPNPKLKKLDIDGNIIWEKFIANRSIHKVLFDVENNLYVGGYFNQIGVFDEIEIEVISPNLYVGKLSDTMSTNEIHSDLFSVIPNPIKDIFQVRANFTTTFDLEIIDFSGKIVFRKKDVNNEEYISINFLPKGIYQVLIHSESKIYSEKLIKL